MAAEVQRATLAEELWIAWRDALARRHTGVVLELRYSELTPTSRQAWENVANAARERIAQELRTESGIPTAFVGRAAEYVLSRRSR